MCVARREQKSRGSATTLLSQGVCNHGGEDAANDVDGGMDDGLIYSTKITGAMEGIDLCAQAIDAVHIMCRRRWIWTENNQNDVIPTEAACRTKLGTGCRPFKAHLFCCCQHAMEKAIFSANHHRNYRKLLTKLLPPFYLSQSYYLHLKNEVCYRCCSRRLCRCLRPRRSGTCYHRPYRRQGRTQASIRSMHLHR